MPRFRNPLAPVRKSLLDPDDHRHPLDSLPLLDDGAFPPGPPPVSPRPNPLRLRAPVGPTARNRVGDVKRVETAIDRAGFLDRAPVAGVFDSVSMCRSAQKGIYLKELIAVIRAAWAKRKVKRTPAPAGPAPSPGGASTLFRKA